MKKTIIAAALILGLAGMNPVFAEQKIAVVDVQAVVSSSSQVKSLKKANENNMKELEKWIKVAKDDIEAMINRVKNIAVPASKYNTVSTVPKNLGRRQIARM